MKTLPIRDESCPACGYHVAAPFYDGGMQPLSTLAWPSSAAEAQTIERLPLDFVRCLDCGHIFNARFDYLAVPYSSKPNLMFNRGERWMEHLRQVTGRIVSLLPSGATAVEIGHGDASFLSALSRLRPDVRFVGFDPNGSADGAAVGVTLHRERFEAGTHLDELRPDLILSRHVLEHLTNPLRFLQSISVAAADRRLSTRMYFEVPCVDRAIAAGRTVDFFYEHNSQFTSGSFRRMLERSGAEIEDIGLGYGNEVVYGFVRTRVRPHSVKLAAEAEAFFERAQDTQRQLRLQLLSLHLSGRSVAVWGGTGKAAAFMNRHDMDAVRFPVVVDSDPDKAGTFVPGTGQQIRRREYLLQHPVDVILIPTQWRAADISEEIRMAGIPFAQILIEHEGRLVDFFLGAHPYRLRPEEGSQRRPDIPGSELRRDTSQNAISMKGRTA